MENCTLPFGGEKFIPTAGRQESLSYALELARIEFKELPDGEYLFNLCFFDFHTRRFAGNKCVQACTARNSKIQLDHHFLFHSLSSINTVVIVLELANRNQNALCWTILPLGGISELIEPSASPNVSATVQAAQFRRNFPLFAGSCRVLLLATRGMAQLEPHLRRLDAILSAALRLTSTPIAPAIPHFHLLAQAENELILAAQRFTALLDNARLSFANGGQKESDGFLLELLAREFCYAMNRKWVPGQMQMRVLERRLKIGAHDGFGFVEEPICVLLEQIASHHPNDDHASSQISLRQRSRSLGRVDIHGVDFVARQNIRLRSIPLLPDLAIVFELDYLVGCPLGNGQDLMANTRLIPVAWTAWCPCNLESAQPSQADTITLQLIGGPRPAPAPFGLCLRDLSVLPAVGSSQWPPLPPQRVRMDLHFNFVPLPEDGKRLPKELSQLSLQQTPLPKPDRVPAEEPPPRPPSAPSLSSHSQSARATVPSKNKMQPISVDVPKGDDFGEKEFAEKDDTMLLWPMSSDISPQQFPSSEPLLAVQDVPTDGAIRVELPLGRIHPLPRPLISQLSKFPPISTPKDGGPPPNTVDLQSHRQLDIAVELNDIRWPGSELSIQLLGFAPANGAFPRPQQPARIFCSFQLFRFESVQTESLFIEPNENMANHEFNGQQLILWREGATQPGLTIRFTVNAEQREDLANYLFGHQLHLHVWEADSLFHLGVASIPLKHLLRQGSPAVQCALQCPVFQSGFPPVWCPSGQSPILNGLLFVRMANIGLSGAHFDNVNSRSFRPNRKHVQSLHAGQQSPLERFLALQRLDLAQRSARLFGPEEEKRIRQWNQLKSSKPSDDRIPSSLRMPRKDTEKFLFAEELAAYRALRREGKALALLKTVFSSITTNIHLNLTLGQVHFFTFQLRNPLAEDFVCELESNDTKLRPINSPDELKYFRQNQLGISKVEENLWQRNGENESVWKLGLHSMEKLDLPMRFDPGVSEGICGEEREYRVFVRRIPSGHPLAILEAKITIHRPYLAQHLRWFSEEGRKLMRVITLPKAAHSLRCSDPTVFCQLQEAGRLLRIECQSGDAPHIREFLLFLFGTQVHTELLGVWRVSIHSLARIHSETLQGQPVRIQLPLPSTPSPAAADGELIRLHCTPPQSTMRFHPGPAFPAQFGVQPALLLNLGQLGRFHLLVNAVRASAQQPVAQWLLSLSVGQPNVTKVFQVIVPAQVQQIVHKRIPLDNPLGIPRQYLLSSSDPNLLSVPNPETALIPPNTTIPVQLNIHPPTKRPVQCQALLFVQDAQTGSQEEAFQLNIRFH